MKVWLVYQVGEPGSGSPPFLYGYALNKEVKQSFEKERNMKYFRIREKEIKKSDISKFQDQLQWKRLDFFDFITSDDDSITGISKIRLVTTENEAIKIYNIDDQIFNLIADYTRPEMLRVKKKYKKVLSNIYYYAIYHWYGKGKDYFNPQDWISFDSNAIFKDKNVKIDQFGVYMRYYGKTLKYKKEKR